MPQKNMLKKDFFNITINDYIKKNSTSIFFSSLFHQTWRRVNYILSKKKVLQSVKTRKGNCKRCGRCCWTSMRCNNLDYDINGMSICKAHEKKPGMCRLYPYSQKDFFPHIRNECGFRFEEQ